MSILKPLGYPLCVQWLVTGVSRQRDATLEPMGLLPNGQFWDKCNLKEGVSRYALSHSYLSSNSIMEMLRCLYRS